MSTENFICLSFWTFPLGFETMLDDLFYLDYYVLGFPLGFETARKHVRVDVELVFWTFPLGFETQHHQALVG